jgi:hypothetical protein
MTVNGRQLALDELAVCDLCGSDENEAAPCWQVRKKQQIEVEVGICHCGLLGVAAHVQQTTCTTGKSVEQLCVTSGSDVPHVKVAQISSTRCCDVVSIGKHH